MSYDTYYEGEFTVSPPLTSEDVSVIINRGENVRTEYGEKFANPFGFVRIPLDPDDPGTMFRIETNPIPGTATDAVENWLAIAVSVLTERGHTVTGIIFWEGDEREDRGRYIVRDGKVIAQQRPDRWIDR